MKIFIRDVLEHQHSCERAADRLNEMANFIGTDPALHDKLMKCFKETADPIAVLQSTARELKTMAKYAKELAESTSMEWPPKE